MLYLEEGGRPLPGLTLRRRIGCGAFGEVWAAADEAGQAVALKFLDCRRLPSAIVSSEIRVLRHLRHLRHPNIIEFYNAHATDRFIILSMELADGNLEDLRQAYQDETGRNFPADHLLEILAQAAVGLDFLSGLSLPSINPSSVGLQHCDVKPSNLLLLGNTVKIADFGLCAGTGWKTHRKGCRGTPPYAAPELYQGRSTPGSDQYALAVTYLKLCTGERAFWKGGMAASPNNLPVDLTKVRGPEVPVLARALHPQSSSRWPSCQHFIAALREAVLVHRPPPPVGGILHPVS
jgi:serine/threonine protein kinase